METSSTPQNCPSSNIQVGAAEVSGHPNGTAFSGSESTPSGTASGAATSASATATQTPGAGSVVKASLGGMVLAGAAAFAVVF